MKAQELRIGNFILTVKDNHLIHFKSFFGLCNVEVTPDKFKPIPLTEEWLLKFGFERHINKLEYDYLMGKFGLCYDIDDDCYFVYKIDIDHNIKYVHQLQNLYFALTGEELKLQSTE